MLSKQSVILQCVTTGYTSWKVAPDPESSVVHLPKSCHTELSICAHLSFWHLTTSQGFCSEATNSVLMITQHESFSSFVAKKHLFPVVWSVRSFCKLHDLWNTRELDKLCFGGICKYLRYSSLFYHQLCILILD